MDENKEQEAADESKQPLNSPSTDEPIASTETSSEVEQSLTLKPSPSTVEDMEVHHHTHHEHGKRNWKSYFWEFLMLFLAVFCGFLAEYQLEHKIEQNREKQYMQTIVEDLAADTAMCSDVYERAQIQKNISDSILELIYYHQPLNEQAITQLYTLQYSIFLVTANFEDRTKSQLKNSGAMRLIRKKNVNDSILGYWRRSEGMENVGDRITEINGQISTLVTQIFYTKYLIPAEDAATPPIGIKPGAKLITKDPVQLYEYANRQYIRRGRVNALIERSLLVKERATRLIELIKKEYHVN